LPYLKWRVWPPRGLWWSFVVSVYCTLSASYVLAFDISASNTLTAAPGDTVTVVVSMIDVANGPPGPVESIDLTFKYDSAALSLDSDALGSFFPGSAASTYAINYAAGGPGQVSISIITVNGLAPIEGGELLLLDFTVLPTTAGGLQVIDLTLGDFNEGFISTLVDGLITVATPVAETNINAIIWLLLNQRGAYDE